MTQMRGRVIKRVRRLYVSQCALCDRTYRTRYGFRAHMWNQHGYVSKAHRISRAAVSPKESK